MRALLVFVALAAPLTAQREPSNGPRTIRTGWHALVHGTAVPEPGKRVADATIVLRDGRIVSIAAGAPPPEGARVWDCKGLTIYAGFVEAHHAIDAPAPDPKAPGTHWSPKVTPQRHALDGEGLPAELRETFRELGFGAVAIAPKGGIFRGTAALVSTRKKVANEGDRVIRDHCYLALAFDRSSGYPGSEMGVMAALRQGFLDANWYARALSQSKRYPRTARRPEQSDALAALEDHRRRAPFLFDCKDELQLLRSHKIAGEFGLQGIVLGSGLEFRRVDAVLATKLPVLVPVDFPLAPDVGSVAKAERVSLRELMTWEQAPTNAKRLLRGKALTAFTTSRLEKLDAFHAGVRKAIEVGGLTADEALAMLTTRPAQILAADSHLGRIAEGQLANLVLVEGGLFDEKRKIRTVFVEGAPHIVSRKKHDLDGRWRIALSTPKKPVLEVAIDDDKVTLTAGEKKVKATKVQRKDRHLTFLLEGESFGMPGQVAIGGHATASGYLGRGYTPDGELFQFVASRIGDLTPDDKKKAKSEADEDPKAKPVPVAIAPLPLPFGAYGLTAPPEQQSLLFRGGTVWTSGPKGILENGAVLILEGRVAFVGKAADIPAFPSGTKVIDCTGKHVTPGLIDCHSHTGISRGINESRQTVTSEVRVADVVNPDDIAWYRELAGGLTAANQLHGSANPIGGQNHVVKIRWGARHPDAFSLKGAPGGIKFALGENPKRRGKDGRYPGSRLGVAALIRARFLAAKDYAESLERYRTAGQDTRRSTIAPRRDLELEALAEILAGKRLIHCHSYRQDEIFMLCKLADEFGFKIGTLQHVLEGYKVAEAIKKSALGASSFSDWWAYKLEVIDAIPFNGAIMHEVGVNVSFNSDSSELARRMNTEAGKAVKYGNVAPAEALKFVTLNPAIQLGVDKFVGSLEKGKHGDLAVWSGDPLSYRSVCEATYIDGRAYFTLAKDRELRAVAARERHRLLQKAMRAKEVAESPPPGRRRRASRYHYVDELYSCCEQQQGGR